MIHKPGDVIGGRYRVDRILGRGGMGGVYQVVQLALEKSFALKEMQVGIPDAPRREAAINQFRVEAQILHTLSHPGLPRLYDFFEESGNYYLAMELINGGTLDDYLQNNTVTEAEATQWTEELCSVLHYLHTHHPPVIFRDLKPSNIMLTPNGHIKLVDFGIAKVWDTDKDVNVTRTAIRGAGSPGFAAPEQYSGGTDARTDIYALGATIYSLLTRTMPPQSVDMATGRHRLPDLRHLRPDISERLVRNVEWMMKLDLTERPQNVTEIMQAFGWGSPRPATPLTRPPYWMGSSLTQLTASRNDASDTQMKRRKFNTAWILAAVGVLSGLLTWLGWHTLQTAHPIPTPPVPGNATSVTVTVEPHDAQLFVNQLFQPLVGASPVLKLKPGTYSLAFERSGYSEYDTTLVLDPGAPPTTVVVNLSPAPASLHIDSHPSGANIKIDGEDIGPAPIASRQVGAGLHRVAADEPGFKPTSLPVELAPGDDRSISVVLTPSSLPSQSTPLFPSTLPSQPVPPIPAVSPRPTHVLLPTASPARVIPSSGPESVVPTPNATAGD